jgi:hypothetical protein
MISEKNSRYFSTALHKSAYIYFAISKNIRDAFALIPVLETSEISQAHRERGKEPVS